MMPTGGMGGAAPSGLDMASLLAQMGKMPQPGSSQMPMSPQEQALMMMLTQGGMQQPDNDQTMDLMSLIKMLTQGGGMGGMAGGMPPGMMPPTGGAPPMGY